MQKKMETIKHYFFTLELKSLKNEPIEQETPADLLFFHCITDKGEQQIQANTEHCRKAYFQEQKKANNPKHQYKSSLIPFPAKGFEFKTHHRNFCDQ